MTIQEIARLAGVSPATVSRVFAHHPGIREEVKKKVLSISRQYGYHPRFSSTAKNVVVITPYNSTFPVASCVDMILMALAQALPKHGLRMEVLPVNNMERLENIQFCAAVSIGCELADFPGWAERFTAPLVIMDRPAAGESLERDNVCFVRSDETHGMELALSHLLACGCRKIGCIIHGTPQRGNALIRHQAISRFLKRKQNGFDPNLVVYSGDGTEKYVEIIGKMLKKGVDAFFCPGGNAGLLALYAFSLFGKAVPEEVSLISSEQTSTSAFTVPPLTTISPDYPGMAEMVCRTVLDWIDHHPLPPEITLPYHLIERESCRTLSHCR